MWSNGHVADDDPDQASPWERDDWVPETSVPDSGVFARREQSPPNPPLNPPPGIFGEPPAEAFTDPGVPGTSSRPTIVRKVVAAAIILALLIGSAGALFRSGGSGEDPPPTPTPTTAADDRPTATLEALQPSAPPVSSPSVSAPSTTALGAVASPASTQTDGAAELVASFRAGDPPAWTTGTIAVPERLALLAPTEVITLSQTNMLVITEFPSGQTRQLDMSALAPLLQLAVGDGAIVVFSATGLVQIRGSDPVVQTDVGDGVIFVQPWIGTGTFIVTTPDTGPRAPQQDWVLAADGTLELLDNRFVEESTFFSRSFSPGGDALVNAAGGVYAIDPAGNPSRISTGTLLATGSRHWAIEECDEALRCAYSVVEWQSGTVTPGMLDPIVTFGSIDPATSISPDGRSVVYRADSDGSGRRRILDVASGTSVEAGRINQLVYPDSWSTDSSGIFVGGGELQFIDRTAGVVTPIDGLDEVRTVATRPVAP